MNLGHYLTLNQVPGLGKSQLAEPLRLTGSKMSITLELTDLSTGTRLPVGCCHPSRFQKVQRPFPIRVPLHRYLLTEQAMGLSGGECRAVQVSGSVLD